MKRTLISLAVMGSILGADAQNVWTLDSCISYAINHNLTVKSRRLDTYQAELSVTEARDAFLPQASADASQSFNFGRGLTAENTYADRNTAQTGWNVGLQLPLFQGLSATRRLKYSRANLRAVAEQCEAAKDNVELQVITQYLQVLYCGETLDVAMEQKRLSQVQLDRTKILVEEGKVPELELTQARAQVAQDQLSVTSAENDRVLALLDLSQLLQLPTADGFDVAPLGDGDILTMTPDEIYVTALQNNHALRAARLSIDAADKNISLARTGYIPRLNFTAGIGSSYYRIGGIDNPSFGRQMRDNFNKYLGFSLSIPIFDAFSTRNSVRRAEASRNQAALQLEETTSQLYQEINRAYQQTLSSQSRLEASAVAESATREALEAMQVKYDYGRATSTELEQARSEYIRSRLATVQARYELQLRQRILAFYGR